MNPLNLDQLMDTARRRPLTAEEQARLNTLLEANPAAWPDRDEDITLTQLLADLPDAPPAPNFSRRVMQAIDLAEREAGRAARRPVSALRIWLKRLSWATAVVAVAGGSWWQYQHWQLAETARSLQVITEVAAVPSVEILRDLDAVQSLGLIPPAMDIQGDQELLNALQP